VGNAEAPGFDRPGRRRSLHEAARREREPEEAMLEIRGLSAWYGASQVLFDVHLRVGRGETVALVGRNGAGKTTTLRSVMGMGGVRRKGSIRVNGVEAVGMAAHEIARLGVGLVPEGRRVFGKLTVEENLRVASGNPGRGSLATADGDATESAWPLEMVFDVFPLLAEVRMSKGEWLSGGEQQVLAIARALVADPKVLLLDEPSEGLAPQVAETLVEQLQVVRRAGMPMLVAEQHRVLVDELADRVYVLDQGNVR